ncbi:hypothetical protein [Burkholderia pyrrocinia]|nr:hypothetical protein [Burkholderia pyrrocinia]
MSKLYGMMISDFRREMTLNDGTMPRLDAMQSLDFSWRRLFKA